MTDLPFKLGDRSIVIIKSLPVLTQLLDGADDASELRVVKYAA